MTRLISKTLIVCGGVLLLSSAAPAIGLACGAFPDPVRSLKPPVLNLSPVGPAGPLAIPPALARFEIVDDLNGLPLPGVIVTIDMSGCAGILPGPGSPAITLDCGAPGAAGNRASGVTDQSGVVTFQLTGYAISPGGGTPGTVSRCASVMVDLIAFPPINIAAPDQNGVGGVNPADGSLFLADRDAVGSPRNQARSDFNGSGTVNPADGSIMLQFMLAGATTSAPATCP